MFVVVANGYVYLKETLSEVDPETGKKKHTSRIVEKLGRLDKVLEKDPEALNKLKAKFSDEREAKRRKVIEATLALVRGEPRMPAYIPLGGISYAPYLLDRVWQGTLAMDDCFDKLAKDDPALAEVKDDFKAMVYHKLEQMQALRYESEWFAQDDYDGFDDEKSAKVRSVVGAHQEAIWAHIMTAYARNVDGKKDAKPSRTQVGFNMYFSEFVVQVARRLLSVIRKKVEDSAGQRWPFRRIQYLLKNCLVFLEFQDGHLWCRVIARGRDDLDVLLPSLGAESLPGLLSREAFCQRLGIQASTDEEFLGWPAGTITPEFLIRIAEKQSPR